MQKRQDAPVVAVLNMKGGVGKTTISAHLFRVLFTVKASATLLVDIDPQFNLTQALFTRKKYEELRDEGRTIISAMEPPPASGLFEIKTSPEPPPDPTKLGITLWYLTAAPAEKLIVVPGDFRLVKYSLMDDNRKLAAVRERFLTFISMARAKFRIVCIDCNPSSSFLTLCALHACTHVLVPVRPDRYSILGLEMLSDLIDNIPTIHPKPKIIVVLNGMLRSAQTDPIEAELRAHKVFGVSTLAARIYKSELLVANPDYTGFATDKRVPYRNLLKAELAAVAKELASRLSLA